jgi:hypothetical protein
MRSGCLSNLLAIYQTICADGRALDEFFSVLQCWDVEKNEEKVKQILRTRNGISQNESHNNHASIKVGTLGVMTS